MPNEKGARVDNLVINGPEGYVDVIIDKEVFPPPIIHKAAYNFLDRANIILTKDAQEKITGRLRPLKKEDLARLGYDFNAELISVSVYLKQFEDTKEIRDQFMKSAFANR